MRARLAFAFTLSGASALALEVLWMRSAALVAGATASTTTTVLAAIFGGLALGSWVARRGVDRPIRSYARLELGVAAGALASLGLSSLATPEQVTPWLLAHGIAVVVAVILPVATCMGATLPRVGQALASVDSVGSDGGWLYALNTIGGIGGIVAMSFALPARIGVANAYAVAAATSATAAGLAMFGPAPEGPAPRDVGASARPAIRLRAAAAGCGFLAIALESLWTLVFAQVLHNSVYSFAAVSLVFVAAIALGAASASAALRVTPSRLVAVSGLVGAGLASVAGFWIFERATHGFGYVGMETGLPGYLLRIVGLGAITAGPAAFASGAVLPALWQAVRDERPGPVARTLGDLTSWNLAAGALGTLAWGSVLLPELGLRAGLTLLALGYPLVAVLCLDTRGPARALAVASLLVPLVASPVRAPVSHLAVGETERARVESASGVVSVVASEDDLELRLDNAYVLGGRAAAVGERRLGLLPLLLHPSPRTVAFVGMATGITASAAPALGVPETTVVELVPEVVRLAGEHFAPWNGDLVDRADVRILVGDGRHVLATETRRFDVIVSDLFVPWHAGAGSLYAREMLRTVVARLAPGGLYCQWLPLYQLGREEFEVIARTFLGVFPQVTLWRNDFYPDRPVVALVGSEAPIAVDGARTAERVAALPAWARDPLLASPRASALLFVGTGAALAAAIAPDGPENTDDRPVIEFQAPRLTRIGPSGDKDWFVGRTLADFEDRLAAGDDPRSLPFALDDPARDARRAASALFRHGIAARGGDVEDAARLRVEVSRLVPEIVAAADAEPPADGLAEARRSLQDLRVERDRLRAQMESLEQKLDAQR